MCNLAQCQFAQCDQISFTKEIVQSPVHSLPRVNITTSHSVLQSLRSEVRHYDLVNSLQHPIGHSFSHLDAGNVLYQWASAFQVLNIHGGKDVDAGVQHLQDIFVSLSMFAAIDVRMGKFIH